MKTGLYIGRFQPPHKGHRECVEYILEQCDRVVVAVRNTELDEDNPYPLYERIERLRKALPDEGVRIISIPDIDTVFMGRRVGYNLIELDNKTEEISASDIRKRLRANLK